MRVDERIRHYIVSNGIMFKHVAEQSGIDQKRFYRLINGKTSMTVDEYERICKLGLKVDPSIFFRQKFSLTENKSA